MPDLPLRPCAGGCGRLVERARCPICGARYAGPGSQRVIRHSLYDARWRRESALFLLEHPLCADPFKLHGRIYVASAETDHIIPHKGDIRLFRDKNNWQPLCKSCHSRKTAAEGGFGNDFR